MPLEHLVHRLVLDHVEMGQEAYEKWANAYNVPVRIRTDFEKNEIKWHYRRHDERQSNSSRGTHR